MVGSLRFHDCLLSSYDWVLTIDWVQDAARERYRRRQNIREQRKRRNVSPLNRLVTRVFDAGQPYIVIILIGLAPHD